ncbi:DinB family protein [Catalinimonas sp. 4WD22]|uniref:DinB family protein n=1 Tax=Catalinimonas locisalis TaxID=3133978 RepID=UPI0031014A8B
MLKSNLPFIPDFYDTYINQIGDTIELSSALHEYGADFVTGEEKNFMALRDQVYAPGKWTVKDILQHVIDTERVFAYRALRFARNDHTELAGMDQRLFAANTNANERSVDELLYEFSVVRQSTIFLYKSFNQEMLKREGVCFGRKTTVGALGFTIVGHVLHHIKILKERYYPLLEGNSNL